MKITNVTATAESRQRANPIRDALQSLDTDGVCRVVVVPTLPAAPTMPS